MLINQQVYMRLPCEASEVAIGRIQDEPMLDGEGGDVGIRYETGPELLPFGHRKRLGNVLRILPVAGIRNGIDSTTGRLSL